MADSIETIIAQLGIRGVLHFTTNRGLIGIAVTGQLKSRALLEKEAYLEFIFQANAAARDRDLQWTRFVNLSVTRINPYFFSWSRRKHVGEELWWCILDFDPVILVHDGVLFATTNNIWTGCRRAAGSAGLEALFADPVHQYSTRWAWRGAQHGDNWPTCAYAEVLYPEQVSTRFLQHVYFQTEDHMHHASAQFSALHHATVDFVLAPELFP